jgi:hypothetical protein
VVTKGGERLLAQAISRIRDEHAERIERVMLPRVRLFSPH